MWPALREHMRAPAWRGTRVRQPELRGGMLLSTWHGPRGWLVCSNLKQPNRIMDNRGILSVIILIFITLGRKIDSTPITHQVVYHLHDSYYSQNSQIWTTANSIL